MGKLILLVLDGFGIGAMDDCKTRKPEDMHANTYRHLRETVALEIPMLYSLGLGKLTDDIGEPLGAYGRSNLAHYGADTFMGHQELMGSKPEMPVRRLMSEIGPKLKASLEASGYRVRLPVEGGTVLLVEDAVVVGDNLESQPGNIINVVGDLNVLPFEEIVKIARIVRAQVDTSRVIVFGNKKTDIHAILSAVREKSAGSDHHPGQWGVDAPKANVYGEGYQVVHLGYGVDYEKQFAYMAETSGIPVYRIGKTADVIQAGGFKDPVVNTKDVLDTFRRMYQEAEPNAVFLVNVQETDLAGHQEDCHWYKEVLEEADRFLESFIPELGEDDMLIITADHGNDPTIGHSNHTREQTPILIAGNKILPVSIGERETMADIAATMAEYAGIPAPEYGTSFWQMLTKR